MFPEFDSLLEYELAFNPQRININHEYKWIMLVRGVKHATYSWNVRSDRVWVDNLLATAATLYRSGWMGGEYVTFDEAVQMCKDRKHPAAEIYEDVGN